jgi:NTP pyrophosphatase (non-canonical NTP hydrolase)
MTISELSRKAHANALDKGFWSVEASGETPNIAEKLMLIVSEVSEALEALRNNNFRPFPKEFLELARKDFESKEPAHLFKTVIKNHMSDELADIVIRVADLAGYMNIDLETHIELKIAYNATRERLHGKRF